jgi:hypothetical protein
VGLQGTWERDILLLELIQGLSKFAQSHGTFIINFVYAFEFVEIDIFAM